MNSKNFNAHPLTFYPIFKQRIWGGDKLKTILNKNIPNATTGESWEISAVQGDESIVNKGFYNSKKLTDLISQFPAEILGSKIYEKYGATFPLLFKYLDAQQDLSVQVHPNDELAQKRHHCFGKTEMWYVLQAEKHGSILVGFKKNSNQKEYLEALENKQIETLLDKISVKKGDVFFLDTGTVHAIGAGTLIAEIQQSSDITYRIYDFDRKDADGNTRELHTDLALEAINFEKTNAQREYSTAENLLNNMVKSPYFTTKFLPLNGEISINKSNENFLVYMCTEGNLTIDYKNQTFAYTKGETILIPATMTEFIIAGKAILLEISI